MRPWRHCNLLGKSCIVCMIINFILCVQLLKVNYTSLSYTYLVHSFVQWAHILKNVKKQMTKRYNSNILFRGHSMLNGLIKDFVAFFEPSTWTDEDEIRKKKIFKTIIVDGKCWYCGCGRF